MSIEQPAVCSACRWLCEVGVAYLDEETRPLHEGELPNSMRLEAQQLAFYWLTHWYQQVDGGSQHNCHVMAAEAMAEYSEEPWRP